MNAPAIALGQIVLFFVFLILKLAQVGMVAGWSWWWVTAPLWGLWALLLPLLFVLALMPEPKGKL